MAWRVEYSAAALKTLRRLDPPIQRRITSFIETRVVDDPRHVGKAMRGDQRAWRYRVGNFRLICDIHDASRTVFVVRIGDRKEVYR
ncbi:MAG: addiction module toxin RelE [Betaproteobacteria bacterium RIFCSPLOWO2_12_FULL_62_58]|nr:MAG: addiction module toxin RelE [Betaproteobacteria bacterium RIFCSPLOWO2_12_FULL_62_58]